MNGPYQDELGRRVRDIAEDMEKIKFHASLGFDGCTARGQPSASNWGGCSVAKRRRLPRGRRARMTVVAAVARRQALRLG